jgi:hypothetical protein
MRKIIKIQFFVLLIATIFGWSNFSLELFDWLNQQACTTGCSATGEVTNPFLTPCFYGAIFFTIAFFLNLLLLFMNRGHKKTKPAVVDTEPPVVNQPAGPTTTG